MNPYRETELPPEEFDGVGRKAFYMMPNICPYHIYRRMERYHRMKLREAIHKQS